MPKEGGGKRGDPAVLTSPFAKGARACGAKTRGRNGEPCRSPAMANGRCWLHGGKAAKGAKNPNMTHGIYSTVFTPEEQELYARVQLGSVDEEIRLLTVRIKRINEALAQIEANPNDVNSMVGFELDEIERHGARQDPNKDPKGKQTGGGGVLKVKSKRPDFRALLGSFVQRKANLEDLRFRMLQQGSGTTMDEQVRQWREAMEALENSVPKPLPEDEDD